MLKGKQIQEELKVKKDIASKDRAQRERESKRSFLGNVVKSPLEVVAKGIGRTVFNDASFYDAVMAKEKIQNVANVPTFTRSGDPLDFPIYYDDDDGTIVGVPTVMSLRYLRTLGPTFGMDGSKRPASAYTINAAIARIISLMRTTTGRQIAYSPDELGTWLLASDEIKVFINRLGTAIKLAKTYSSVNAGFPVALIAAWLNIGRNDAILFIKDIANYEKAYISCAAYFNANVPLPADFGFVKRTSWLSSSIVADRSAHKKQVYMYVPHAILTPYENEGSNNVLVGDSTLGYASGDLPTPDSIISKVYSVINELTLGINYTQLLADIRAAFSNFVQLDCSDGYLNAPYEIVAVDEVLDQIHNTNTVAVETHYQGSEIDSTHVPVTEFNVDNYSIATDGDYLTPNIKINVTKPRSTGNVDNMWEQLMLFVTSRTSVTKYSSQAGKTAKDKQSRVLNFYHDEISSDDMITSTRNVSWWKYEWHNFPAANVTNSIKAEPAICGTEVIYKIDVTSLASQDADITLRFDSFVTDGIRPFGSESLATQHVVRINSSLASAFDWAPLMYFTADLAGDYESLKFVITGEVANYFKYPTANGYELHNLCVMGEFYSASSIVAK